MKLKNSYKIIVAISYRDLSLLISDSTVWPAELPTNQPAHEASAISSTEWPTDRIHLPLPIPDPSPILY